MINEELQQINQKLEKQNEILTDIRVDINYHIKRTDMLEKALEMHLADFRPVRRHVEIVNALFKILTSSAVLAAIIHYLTT